MQKYKFNFSINIPSDLGKLTHLKLFNGYNKLICDQYDNIDTEVDKGIYQLRIEINEHVEDRMYRIAGDTYDQIDTIDSSSSVPIPGLSSTHEYFSYPSQDWSVKSTIDSDKNIKGSSIFLFIRYEDDSVPFEEVHGFEKNFTILNSKRKPIYQLSDTNTHIDAGKGSSYFGSVSFNVAAEPGQYYLLYQSDLFSRELPIYVFENYQTQLFMNFNQAPIFGSVKIMLGQSGFDAFNFETMQLDGLTLKMFNGIMVFPEDLRSYALSGQWANPMLGIIGLYLYLLSKGEKDELFFDLYLSNLALKLDNDYSSPDLRALRLMGAVLFKRPIPEEPLLYPTMVARGMQAYLTQSIAHESLIKKDSIIESILTDMKADSIWTSYTPLPIKETAKRRRKSRAAKPEGYTTSGADFDISDFVIEAALPQATVVDDNKWITDSIFNQLAENPKRRYSIAELARQMQVTPHTIRKSLKILKNQNVLERMATSLDDSGIDLTMPKLGEIRGRLDSIR